MLLSESYKNRLKQLSGIISLDEAMDATTKTNAMNKSSEKVKFSKELMIQAIEQGKEIGLNFQSKNDKYTMPTTKARIVWPVSLGVNKKGKLVLRAEHVTGQSEKIAIQTGVRSAEASDEWRLFKTDNIKSMWFTGNNIGSLIPGYKPNDSAMITTLATYDAAKAKAFQNSEINNQNTEENPIVEKPVVDSNLDSQQSKLSNDNLDTQKPQDNIDNKNTELPS